MDTPTIAMIGAGNMGRSLIGGMIAEAYPAEKIIATNSELDLLKQLQTTYNVKISADNKWAVQAAEVIVLCVKPQSLAEVLHEIAPVLAPTALIISIAAGIRVAAITKALGKKSAIVRCMPNMPALLQCAATALFANATVSPSQRVLTEYILRAVGTATWVEDESLLDVVTALSGSGPAYFFLLMEMLEQSAVTLGLSPKVAQALTRQTALGAARMALEDGADLTELRRYVTSPGGTTEKAIGVLELGAVRSLFQQAILAASERSKQLADELENRGKHE